MSSFEKDANVWYYHSVETWIPTMVKIGGSGDITVVTDDGEEFIAAADSGNLMPLHPSSLTAVPDMVSLGDMNNAALLHNLRLRFWEDDIFTYIGPILVAVNPYKRLPIFTPAFVEEYYGASPGSVLTPHVYDLAMNCFKQMQEEGKDQSIVISGESGAGKTEETKLCLQFLASVAGASSPSEEEVKSDKLGCEQLLLQSSPILESFGNAKTVRNNNSSRFGKYMQVGFSKQLKITGGNTIKYLLEKTRVVKLGPGERNYHIFYQVATCLPDNLKKAYDMQACKNYYYLNQSGVYSTDGWDDAREFEDFNAAFVSLGIPDDERFSVFKLVAGLLWLGNHTFSGDDESEIDDDDVTDRAADLFDVDAEMLGTTLTYRNMQSGGRSIVVIPLTPAQAEESRDGLARAAYSKLFDWIVDRVNLSTNDKDNSVVSSIGVLDIFGFEIFELNSFEQLCINLANEKLQNHFNGHIFKLEQEVYKQESLNIDAIEYVDNQGTLDLIEKKPKGIFPMLDEECFVPKGSDQGLLDKLADTHRKSDHFERKRKKGVEGVFTVNHYAGGVCYSVEKFLEKNRDLLQPDIQSFMAGSKNKLVQTLFPPPKPKRGRAPTMGGQFKKSLQELYNQLMATSPFFIKCVKPNTVKQPGVFDSRFTLRQLTYLGLLEVIRIRRMGYPVRRDPQDFFDRYVILDKSCKDAKSLAAKVGLKDEWQMGKTKLFMKDGMYFHLESKRGMVMEDNIKKIQAFLKSEYAGLAFKMLRRGFVLFQAVIRGNSQRSIVDRLRQERVVDMALATAMKERSAALLKTAIDQANDISYAPKCLKDARELMERVKKENKVQDLIDGALEAEDDSLLETAIMEAKQINYKDNSVAKAAAKLKELRKKAKAKAKARSQGAAKKDITEALKCKEAPQKQRVMLMKALAHAEEQKLDNKDVQAAKAMLADIIAKMDAAAAMEESKKAGDAAAMRDALEAAKKAGTLDAAALKEAEDDLKQQDAKGAAKKELKAVLSTQNVEKIQAAITLAEACKYEGEELKHAQLLLKQISDAKKNTKSGVLARSKDMNYDSMVEEQSKVFKMAGFNQLRSRDGSSLVFSKLPIRNSLLKFDGKHAPGLSALAISIFNSILGYQGAAHMQYPTMLALEVLQKGLEVEELRDEIYMQCIKQTNRSSGEHLARAWQMIYLLARTFSPSEDFFPYVRAHVYLAKEQKGGVEAADAAAVAAQAESIFTRLENMFKKKAADVTPTLQQIEALRNREELQAVLYFLDNSMKKYPITEETSMKQLVATICRDLSYDQGDTCGIYDVKNQKEPAYIKSDLRVFDVMQGWQTALMGGFKGKMGLKKISSHKLVFRKRLFLSEPAEKISCAVDLHLLFSQARLDVSNGRFAITEVEALLLASLTLQIEYGDFDAKKHQGGFLRDVLQEYIPANIYRLHKPKIWERDLLKTYEKMAGFTEVFAKKNYLRVVEKSPTYGYTMFYVKQTHLKGAPQKVFLGVNGQGLKVFRTDDKAPVTEPDPLSFANLQSWSCVPGSTCSISLGRTKVVFQTELGEDICALLKSYALVIVARRQRKSKK